MITLSQLALFLVNGNQSPLISFTPHSTLNVSTFLAGPREARRHHTIESQWEPHMYACVRSPGMDKKRECATR